MKRNTNLVIVKRKKEVLNYQDGLNQVNAENAKRLKDLLCVLLALLTSKNSTLYLMGAGILPVALHNNKLYFIFGKEVSNGKWGDFGGGKEKNETPIQTACRECSEEFNGFLGNKTKILSHLRKHELIMFQTKNKQYKTFLYITKYEPSLPNYFNNNASFLIQRFPDSVSNKSNGYFEKSQIDWFDKSKLERDFHKFRGFYKEIVKQIIENYTDIKFKITNLG